MKKKKIFIIMLIITFLLTGCTKTLKNGKEVIKNPETGQNLTQNILCRPTDEDLIKLELELQEKVKAINSHAKPMEWFTEEFNKVYRKRR